MDIVAGKISPPMPNAGVPSEGFQGVMDVINPTSSRIIVVDAVRFSVNFILCGEG